MSKSNIDISEIFFKILILLSIVFVLFAATSCKCPCAVTGTETETIVTVHTHDTTVVTQADSASVKLLLRCDSANNVLIDQINVANGERLQMQMQLQSLAAGSGTIAIVDCKEDSLIQIIQWQDSVIRSKTTETIVKIEKQKGFVYYCGWALIGIVCACAIAFIIGLIIKFAK